MMKYLSFLVKPASSMCNLKCPYCFYADVSSRRKRTCSGKMQLEMMQIFIDRAVAETDADAELTFAFQGGEPMLAGLEYYQRFTAYVREKKGRRTVRYAIQTNGTLIDEEWARFFAKEPFLVGVSLDGYESNTNRFRLDKNGKGMYTQIMEGIRLLERFQVDYNILTVLTPRLAAHPEAYYRFLKAQGFSYVQCIPCLGELPKQEKRLDGERPETKEEGMKSTFTEGTEQELKPKQYAEFYKRFYRLWLEDYAHGEYMSVTLFDNLLLMLSDRPPQQCGMLGFCTAQLVVEADGSVYPCDFYVLDEYCCGNLKDHTLQEILYSKTMQHFLREEKEIKKICETCPFWKICRGGCKRQNRTYLTEAWCGHREFLMYAYPTLSRIAQTL